MSKNENNASAGQSRQELKARLIHEVLKAQKAVLLDANKANSSANVLAIVKRLIPKK
jgi:hypothetical protein